MIPYSFTVTSHIVITLAFSMLTFVGINVIGIRTHGFHLLSLFLKITNFEIEKDPDQTGRWEKVKEHLSVVILILATLKAIKSTETDKNILIRHNTEICHFLRSNPGNSPNTRRLSSLQFGLNI